MASRWVCETCGAGMLKATVAETPVLYCPNEGDNRHVEDPLWKFGGKQLVDDVVGMLRDVPGDRTAFEAELEAMIAGINARTKLLEFD